MSSTVRTVRHLRVAASDPQAVRALLPRLEDALRCASLPDAGQRVLVVRKLALGRVPRQATPQQLSLLIEQRLASAGVQVVDGTAADAEQAQAASFASPLHARVVLVVRLLRRQSCTAWYWPLAVREFDCALNAAANVRRIAEAIAGWPEASVALPAWAGEVVAEVGAHRLVVAVGGALGAELEQAVVRRAEAGVAGAWRQRVAQPPLGAPTKQDLQTPSVSEPVLAASSRAAARDKAVPAQLTPPLAREASAARWRWGSAVRVTEGAVNADSGASADDQAAAVTQVPTSRESRRRPRAGEAALATAVQGATSSGEAHAQSPGMAQRAARGVTVLRKVRRVLLYREPTAFGGLLFLLPVLARLGLSQWLEGTDTAQAIAFARAVLRAALHRLQAASDDAMVAMLAPQGDDVESAAPIAAPAPATWRSDWLCPRTGGLALAAALEQADTRDAQLTLWLTAARRWLRLIEGIGLATLTLRQARLAVTATHADVHFALANTDIRVRRRGLDIDPGWLPWFGRVVAFHFEPEAA